MTGASTIKNIHRTVFVLIISMIAAGIASEGYSISRRVDAYKQKFPKPLIVRKQVRFWEKIFQVYPATTVIVHDSKDPDKLIDIIDHDTFMLKALATSRKKRDKLVKKYISRYERGVKRFRRMGKRAITYGAIEKRLYNVYKNSPRALANLYKGKVSVRGQTGLSGDFVIAAKRAQKYLPKMERIFRKYGVPWELTRVAFVESMFNVKAFSKVGASGIWQFMPATARKFMFVNKMVDERSAPFKATKAAAQLLSSNYRVLKSWPLAITAYNHGATGLKRATRKLGTKDISQIIKYHRSRTFGFASRNFYAEYLAAYNTYEKLLRENPKLKKAIYSSNETITFKDPISMHTLMNRTKLSKHTIQKYNPDILNLSFTKYRYKPLPRYYQFNIPNHLARNVKTALHRNRNKRYARRN